MRRASERLLGFAMLLGTLTLWIASSVVVQDVIGRAGEFRKPMFITLFNGSMSVSLLVPSLAKTTLGMADLACVVRLSASVGMLWLLAQWMYNMSLLHTSVATNTVLSSTSAVFTYLLSLVLCGDPLRWLSFGAALMSFTGCALVAAQVPQNLDEGATRNSTQGDAQALLSAALFSLSSVLLRKWAPPELDLSCYMGAIGLLSLTLAPPLLLSAHLAGLEAFAAPAGRTLGALALNALLGCSFANYLYNSAVLLLSPFVASVFLSLSIPLSAFTDQLLLGEHRFSEGWAVGASIASLGAALAAVDFEGGGGAGVEDPHAARLEPGEAAELQSLLGLQDEELDSGNI